MTVQEDVAAKPARRPLGWLWRTTLLNLPFLLALGAVDVMPAFLETLVVGAIVFLAPGLAWADHRKGDAFVVMFRIVLASLAASLIVWLALMPLAGPTSRIGFIVALAAITNIGLALGFRRGWYAARPFNTRLARLMFAVGALFFLQSYLGAAYFVPALEDQDMETQGTAYGLINELSPTMPTNRDTPFFFAHPLLLHFWIGESALVSDDLGRLRHYHQGSLAAQADRTQIQSQWEISNAQFERDPVLLPTRTPNLFLGVFCVLALGSLVFRLTGSHAAAVGACVIYATLPEVYVRTSYGGYMAVTNFLLVSGAYFYVQAAGLFPNQSGAHDRQAPALRFSAAAAFLGGWADQKSILLPFAAPVHAVIRALSDRALAAAAFGELMRGRLIGFVRRMFACPEIAAAFTLGVAFLAGWGVFAVYGLSISPADFIEDHLRDHVAGRLTMTGVDLVGDDWWYPSVLGLWIEFIRHSGWLLALAAIPAGWRALRRIREADGMFFLWVAIGAIGFSVVDWRQTKHLAHILPPLALLVAVYWASLEGRARHVLTAVLGAGVLWNVWRVGLLMGDFTTLQPTPIW